MMVFFKIWPENIKKAFMTLQALRFELNCLLNLSIVEIDNALTTIFSDSAIFIGEKRVENRLWAKRGFLWSRKMHHRAAADSCLVPDGETEKDDAEIHREK